MDDNSRLAEVARILDERTSQQDRPRVSGAEHLYQLQDNAQVHQNVQGQSWVSVCCSRDQTSVRGVQTQGTAHSGSKEPWHEEQALGKSL